MTHLVCVEPRQPFHLSLYGLKLVAGRVQAEGVVQGTPTLTLRRRWPTSRVFTLSRREVSYSISGGEER